MKTTTRGMTAGERWRFDFGTCSPARGWATLNTAQDASYFGVWVNPVRREVFSFAEGDTTLVACGDDATFAAHLGEAIEWYADNDGREPRLDAGAGASGAAIGDRLRGLGFGRWLDADARMAS